MPQQEYAGLRINQRTTAVVLSLWDIETQVNADDQWLIRLKSRHIEEGRRHPRTDDEDTHISESIHTCVRRQQP
eukprot:13640-Eustigmatos_ZCMA.PRE.1